MHKNRKVLGYNASQQLGMSLEAIVKKQRRRGRTIRLVSSLLATLGLFASGMFILFSVLSWIVKFAVLENEKYRLLTVEVETTGSLRREQVLKWAEIPSRTSLLTLDVNAVRERLLRHSEIGEARVSKILPNKLEIKVFERRPVARVVTNIIIGQGRILAYVLDKNGIVISPRPGEDFTRLPEITGANLLDIVPGERVKSPAILSALKLLQILETSRLRPKLGRLRLDISQGKNLLLSTPGGGWVTFSQDAEQLEQQVERLAKIMEHSAAKTKRIKSADLTVTRNVPVVFMDN